MAQQALKGLGVPIEEIDPQKYADDLENDELFTKVHERRSMRSIAWLLEIGFEKPGTYEGLPVKEAEAKAQAEKEKILEIVRKQEYVVR